MLTAPRVRPSRRGSRSTAVVAAVASVAAVAANMASAARAQSGPPRFRYVPELEMVHVDKKGRLRIARVDAATGLALVGAKQKPRNVVAPFLAVRTMRPGAEEVFQHHLRDVSILHPMQYNGMIRDDLGFAAGVDRKRDVLVLSRLNHLQRHESTFEVSNVIGLVQRDECYLGQLEMRWGADGRVLHVKRTRQRAGPLLGQGFPSWIDWEMVQTATASGTDSARMVRIAMVFPSGPRVPGRTRVPARVRVHLVGDFRRRSGGRVETRKVHVISEFKKAEAGLDVKLWTSVGEKNPYISWEEAIGYKHEHEWQTAGSGSVGGTHEWERPYQPFSPVPRGVRPIPVIALLKLPAKFRRGGYSGAVLGAKKVVAQNGRWILGPRDFAVYGGMWQFDRKGGLVVVTPLGSLSAKQVLALFRRQFAAAQGDPESLLNLRDCLDTVLNWAADMPQLPGAGPGAKAPAVRQLLVDK